MIKKNQIEINIFNIKLFSREEEEELIKLYSAPNTKVPYNSNGLRTHLPVAANFRDRVIISYDSVMIDGQQRIESKYGFIIKYGLTNRMISDSFGVFNEKQNNLMINRMGMIIDHVKEKIAASKRKRFPSYKVKEKKYVTKKYSLNGKTVYFCPIRNILTPATEEENIRQLVLLSLLNVSKIPSEFIKVEENLAHYNKSSRDRADIIVMHPETEKPWILYELKASNKTINDNTLNQAERYNDILNCEYICLYNGKEEYWYNSTKQESIRIQKPLSIDKLLDSDVKYYINFPFERPSLSECYDPTIINIIKYGYNTIGVRTPPIVHPFIVNFYGFLMEEKKFINQLIELEDFTIIEDGKRKSVFGNAGGGFYNGIYRYFVLKLPNGNNTIISISIFSVRKGYSSLNVAIDDYNKSHNSLQLRIDSNVKDQNGKWIIYHDGRLTRGHAGGVKVSDVINYCKKYIPDMITHNKFLIGSLPQNELFTWTNTKHIIVNLIRYALVRDQFRNQF